LSLGYERLYRGNKVVAKVRFLETTRFTPTVEAALMTLSEPYIVQRRTGTFGADNNPQL
jgi:hypothetical protein